MNAGFGKTMENARKHRDIKFVTTKGRRNYLVSKPNHNATEMFLNNLLTKEMKREQILMNKPIYLGISILKICKIVMYEFWCHYVKPKYGEKAQLWEMDTNSFTVYINAEDIYINIRKDVETKFDTSNYELDRPIPKGKKVLGLIKGQLDGKIMTGIAVLRPKTYEENKKCKRHKKMCHKTKTEIRIL